MSENCVRRKKESTNPEIFVKLDDQFSKHLSKCIPKRVQFPKRADDAVQAMMQRCGAPQHRAVEINHSDK